MHVVTFYSFKGGVGRTMALVNTAVALAKRKRHVLVVDLDLEAPGLTTYDIFLQARACRGLVHYVHEYLGSGRAPHVEEFVAQRVWQAPEGGAVSVMPSGAHDPDYATKLSELSWHDLYAERDGFLLFEDLKQQWRTFVAPDYVLIDSRTGHTDVGGICTRQLADAVVAVFSPTDQNLFGLTKVVDDIRREGLSPRNKSIHIHFVMSNIPDLDDEDSILRKRMDTASQRLGYEDPCLTIHHYNSLALLDQSIFVLDHPRSRLAGEYGQLVDAIASHNLEDRIGALAHIRGLSTQLKNGDVPDTSRLADMATIHGTDGDVMVALAQVHQLLGDVQESIQTLTSAIELGRSSPHVLVTRAQLWLSSNQDDNAVKDLVSVLNCPAVSPGDLSTTARLLSRISADHLSTFADTPAVRGTDADTKFRLAQTFCFKRSTLPIAETLYLGAMAGTPSLMRDLARNEAILTIIGQSRFAEAMVMIANHRNEPGTGAFGINDALNYAMADWGAHGEGSPELFQRVIDLDKMETQRGANYEQCLSIALCHVGQKEEAHRRVARARQACGTGTPRSFSAWRYLMATTAEFFDDMREIDAWIDGGQSGPWFVQSQLKLDRPTS